MSTWALVENADPAILYDGPWINLTSKLFDFDLSGSSAHYLLPGIVNSTTSPATLSFSFIGREIAVFGVASIFNNTVPVPDSGMPVWECFIDDDPIPTNHPYGTYPLQSYCDASGLDDGSRHTFELRVTESGSGFWIDFIRYLVPPHLFHAIPPNTTAWIGASDPRLGSANGGWTAIGDGFMTSQTGTSATEIPVISLNFFGSSLTWYGLTKAAMGISNPNLTALSLNDTSLREGFYTVDDSGSSQNFTANVLKDVAHANTNPYNVVLFTTPLMETGLHTVNVYYDVNSTIWPLTLDSLTITDGFSITTSQPSSETPTPGFIPPPKSNKAAIIGGALGGVLGGIVIITFILFVRRRWYIRRGESRRRTMLTNIERNDIKMRPFSRIMEDGPQPVIGGDNLPPRS